MTKNTNLECHKNKILLKGKNKSVTVKKQKSYIS